MLEKIKSLYSAKIKSLQYISLKNIEKVILQELKDEISIKNQAQQNLMFAVGGLSETKQANLSQTKEEFILKCSFNQRDCDIDRYPTNIHKK